VFDKGDNTRRCAARNRVGKHCSKQFNGKFIKLFLLGFTRALFSPDKTLHNVYKQKW